jgi:hypothetical protein
MRGRAILFHDTGELGNRLVSYAYLLAYSAEHRVPVTNLCFWRYADLFEDCGGVSWSTDGWSAPDGRWRHDLS